MSNLDFDKVVTLTSFNGSIYTFIRGIWCDSNGIPCDEGTAEYMQNILDSMEWEQEEDSSTCLPAFLDF